MADPIEPPQEEPGFFFGKYRKSVTALAVGGLGWAVQVVTSDSGPITSGEWVSGGVALAVALGVYVVPNK